MAGSLGASEATSEVEFEQLARRISLMAPMRERPTGQICLTEPPLAQRATQNDLTAPLASALARERRIEHASREVSNPAAHCAAPDHDFT